MPQLSVIIVSYNTREMTLQCLQTLLEHSRDLDFETLVVDNASVDGSVDAIRAQFPDVKIIASDENMGFGRANNRAMEVADAPFFLLLNSDAFVHDGALKTLLEYSLSQPRVGVVGPRLLNRDGSVQKSVYQFPTPLRAWQENMGLTHLLRNEKTEVRAPWLVGACMMVRREVWRQVGGFDERFFMYQEETDWQQRIRAAGWEIALEPNAVVTHWGGASDSANADDEIGVSPHFFSSYDLYTRKHHGALGLLSARSAMIVGNAARLLAHCGLAMMPSRRRQSRRKTRFHARLLWRQATHWSCETPVAKGVLRDKNARS